MAFNSLEFIALFFPSVVFVYFFLLKMKASDTARFFLLAASFLYYAMWNPIHLPVLLGSIALNFGIGKVLRESTRQRLRFSILSLGISLNILILAYFKYTAYFIHYISANPNPLTDLLISYSTPLGISFFTFQQISYIVDSYRKEIESDDIVGYSNFVSFFPQLISGPIVRRHVLNQFNSIWNWAANYRNMTFGFAIFGFGLFKKVIIADSFYEWTLYGFDQATTLQFFESWSAAFAYMFQVYFDFSSYGDMAIGLGLFFNIKLPINFNSPYKALSISDYWRRWHMTFLTFARDYIYIPMGGNRVSFPRIILNVLTIFLIVGLWHGVSWKYIIWGLFNGFGVTVFFIWKSFKRPLPKWLAWLITMIFVSFHITIVRCENLDKVSLLFSGMTDFSSLSFNHLQTWLEMLSSDLQILIKPMVFLLCWIFVATFPNLYDLTGYPNLTAGRKKMHWMTIISAIMLTVCLIKMSGANYVPFIYFSF